MGRQTFAHNIKNDVLCSDTGTVQWISSPGNPEGYLPNADRAWLFVALENHVKAGLHTMYLYLYQ